jgi:alkanesulfonate monooxygenase SsuD/methylene tetrahydromethanopterin reductase-like flavin-dependent oxidoreductase (luciferase family)
MRFGVFLLGDKPPGMPDKQVFDNLLEEARWADELGYDAVWLAEHHFSPYGMIASLPVAAAAIAAATRRVRIGTACIVPAFHHPINLAEQIAMVDVISGGRFQAGFGRGYQAHEFRGFGVPMDESTARFREAVTIIDGLLSQEKFSYHGRFWKLEDVSIHPRPLQRPVPIYCTVMKTPASFDWIAEKGYSALIGNPYQVDPELSQGLRLFVESHEKRGVPKGTENVWGMLNAFVHEDREFARAYPKQSTDLSLEIHRKYSSPFERGGAVPADYQRYADWFDAHDHQQYETILNLDLTLIGDPSTVIGKLERVIEMGWSNLMLRMSRGGAMDRRLVFHSMEMFAKEVIPAVQKLESRRAPA